MTKNSLFLTITAVILLTLACSSCGQQGAWDLLSNIGIDPASPEDLPTEEPVPNVPEVPNAPATGDSPILSDSWHYRMKITIPQVSTIDNLIDFPLLLKLDSSLIDYTKIEPDGSDIAFISSDETPLYHEIDGSWNPSGDSYLWIKIPTVKINDFTEFWMYYSSASKTGNLNPQEVWGNQYLGVWHLNETGPIWINSAGTENAVPSVEAPVTVPAWSGNGISVEQTHPNQGLSAGPFSAGPLTLSFWLDQGVNIGGSRLFVLGDLSLYASDANDLYIEIDRTWFPMTKKYYAANWYGVGPSWIVLTWAGTPSLSEVKLYLNGSLAASSDENIGFGWLSSPLSGNLIMANSGSGQCTPGIWDEVHLSSAVRSEDWINASWRAYNNSLLTYDIPENLP
ncbi:MAG: DUF2341 domain-containing protein [Spirochaetales bacterium]|nr:DUF2341 domain-containing protein [Spirochaetales bacterium]